MSEPTQTRQFGRYQLERLISRGGMGEIYLAFSEGPGGFKKQCVIKRMMPHLASSPEFVARFIDEANIVVHLTHGNIVPVFDMGEVDGEYFIAMEYIAGRDLRDIVKRYDLLDRRMPTTLAAYVVAETCKGLGYAHNKADAKGNPLGIIHRDISPSNILVSREGIVKLTDFGIAKAVSRLGRSITGRLQGKFGYMSPEQASGKSVDRRTDIFSLGTVAFEAFTGVRPFEADTDLATLEKVRHAAPAVPSSLVDGLPEALDAVILKAMALDPDDRYDEVADFGRAVLEATAAAGQAHEKEMAAALRDLFPGKEALHGTPSSGLRLDDVLALEAERMLSASPWGESPTLTAPTPSAPSLSSISRSGVSAPGLLPTPEPLITPTPGHISASQEVPAVPAKRRVSAVMYLLLGVVLAVGAGLLLTPDAPEPGRVSVECNQEQAEILVDNRLRGVCPVSLELDSGQHVVTTRLPGFAAQPQHIAVEPGDDLSVRFDLVALAPDTLAATVDVTPADGEFSFDGLVWARAGVPVLVAPGEHRVRVRAEGHEPQVVSFLVGPESTSLAVTLESVTRPDPETDLDAGTGPTDVVDGSELTARTNPPSDERRSRARIVPDPRAAQIFWDGEPLGVGTQVVEVDDASHTLRVVLDGHQTVERSVSPDDLATGRLTVTLVETTALRAVRVQLNYPGVGELFIDGVSHGMAPTTVRLAPGGYQVRVFNAELDVEETRTVRVEVGEGPQVEAFFAQHPR